MRPGVGPWAGSLARQALRGAGAFAIVSRSTRLVQLAISLRWRAQDVVGARDLARKAAIRGVASGRVLSIGFPRGHELASLVAGQEDRLHTVLPTHGRLDRDWLAILAQARRWDLLAQLRGSKDERASRAAVLLTDGPVRSALGDMPDVGAMVAFASPLAAPWDVAPWFGDPPSRPAWSEESTVRYLLGARDRRRSGTQRALAQIAGAASPPAATSRHMSRIVPYLAHDALPDVSSGYTLRTQAIAGELGSLGWDVRVLPNPYRSRQPEPWPVRWLDGVRYDSLPVADGLDGSEVRLSAHTAAVADYLRANRAQVVVAASNYRNGLVASRAAKELGIPFVYEVRGFWELTRAAAEPEWRSTPEFASLVRMESSVARAADLVITLAETMADALEGRGVSRRNIVVAPNGAPRAEAPFRRPLRSSDALRLAYSGAIVGYEGLHILLDAMAVAGCEGVDVELDVAGDGPELGRLQARARRLGLDGRTRFRGRIPQHEATRLIAGADVFVLPRTSVEVTEIVPSLKPLEAMSLGVPTVVTSLAPNYEYYGRAPVRMVEPGDTAALAAILVEAAGDRDAYQALGLEGMAWQAATATWRHTAGKIGENLDQLQRTNGS
jgi:glycosyltransferase involved in cell wall biosynthesis